MTFVPLNIFPTMPHAAGPRFKSPLFGQLAKVEARAKTDRWLDKVRKSELDMRNGAWIRFDIDEAIKTSDI
jgi:hypothetical protein